MAPIKETAASKAVEDSILLAMKKAPRMNGISVRTGATAIRIPPANPFFNVSETMSAIKGPGDSAAIIPRRAPGNRKLVTVSITIVVYQFVEEGTVNSSNSP